jgi:hypothetical protein
MLLIAASSHGRARKTKPFPSSSYLPGRPATQVCAAEGEKACAFSWPGKQAQAGHTADDPRTASLVLGNKRAEWSPSTVKRHLVDGVPGQGWSELV